MAFVHQETPKVSEYPIALLVQLFANMKEADVRHLETAEDLKELMKHWKSIQALHNRTCDVMSKFLLFDGNLIPKSVSQLKQHDIVLSTITHHYYESGNKRSRHLSVSAEHDGMSILLYDDEAPFSLTFEVKTLRDKIKDKLFG